MSLARPALWSGALILACAGCNAAFGVSDLSYVAGSGGAGGVVEGCHNDTQDGDESDVDCGGSCSPCAVDQGCSDREDCLTALCDDTGHCAECTSHQECAADWFCDPTSGICVAGRLNGDSCDRPEDCNSGFCPGQDGVCCDSPCNLTCEACLAAKTGVADGICDYVNPELDTDPDGECPVESPNSCGSTGAGCSGARTACVLFDSSTQCLAASCTDGAANPAAFCDGEGSCPTVMPTPCSPYVCGALTCLTVCANHADCVSTHYCSSNDACIPKINSGGACSSNAQCVSGLCQNYVCT